MIGRLTGNLVEQGPDGACILDVLGVGYEVFVPLGQAGLGLSPDGSSGKEATTFYVHTHVREDAIVLYGFLTAQDRMAFRTLLTVSGVGPKVALAIIGVLDAGRLAEAVQLGNGAAFKGIPGVGKKTTERILLDLRDKLKIAPGPTVRTQPAVAAALTNGDTQNLVQTLTQLGFRPHEAEQAVAKLERRDERPVEELLREALALLG